jgi:imidazolonepropionase
MRRRLYRHSGQGMAPGPTVGGLVDAVDVYCDSIAFNVRQAERLFSAARELGLPVKMHAEQLSNIGGTQLAARFGALSGDHLQYATPQRTPKHLPQPRRPP